jgi:GDP-D-mannose dehydratase
MRIHFTYLSELFWQRKETLQNEMTPFFPRSPYAASKFARIWPMRTYRETYKLFMSNYISFYYPTGDSGTWVCDQEDIKVSCYDISLLKGTYSVGQPLL